MRAPGSRVRTPLQLLRRGGRLVEQDGYRIGAYQECQPVDLPALRLAAGLECQINALYFKCRWLYPFEPSATTDLPFSTTTGQLTARMMTRSAILGHATVRGAALVELPYEGYRSMVVILPDAADGLADVESRIVARYPDWLAALRRKRVDLQLPRWKVTSDLRLNDALAAMGMPTAFSGAANFTGMADLKPLSIHGVLQQAFVDVDEIGTEAAALTALIIEGGGAEPDLERVVFHADHPFMYVIRDDRTGTILFMGRVVEPGK